MRQDRGQSSTWVVAVYGYCSIFDVSAGASLKDKPVDGKGSCCDAPTESFFNSLKNERVHGTRYRTHREAVADLFEYIEVFYAPKGVPLGDNRSRRHSSLGFTSPTQFMRDWLVAQRTRDTAA